MKITSDIDRVIALLGQIYRIQGGLRTMNAPNNSRLGLASLEVTVLGGVVSAETPLTPKEIGQILGHSRQAIQRAIRALEAKGYVTLEADPDRRRVCYVLPTEAGRKIKRETENPARDIAAHVTRHFPPDRIAFLLDEMTELSRVVAAREEA